MKRLITYCGLVLTFLLSLSDQTPTHRIVRPGVAAQGTDCSQIKTLQSNTASGVYFVQPPGGDTFKVYCEMRTDGGWTVFQRRTGGKVSFNQKWNAYKLGFGNLRMDHWLGLRQVFSLTKSKSRQWVMRVDLWDHEGGGAFAEYSDFRLGTEKEAFKLHVGPYSGNAGDAIRGAYARIDQNGVGFSTVDRHNDGCDPCCSASQGGGWWFSRCGSAAAVPQSLNGDWHPAGDHIGWASGLHWLTWKQPFPSYSARATRMMVKSV